MDFLVFKALNGNVWFRRGQTVAVLLDDDGCFTGTIVRIDENTMTVEPVNSSVQRVFPKGYTIGAAHWHSAVVHQGVATT